MMFHTELSEEAAEDGYMVLSINGQEIAKGYPDENYKDANGRYLFDCSLTAVQMSEDVVATYYWGNNQSYSKTISIAEYAELLINGEEYTETAKNLVKALINYGHYAQPCLAAEHDWTVGSEHPETAAYGELTATAEDLAPYAVVKSGSDPSISATNMRLLLDSKTSMCLLFTTDERPTVTVDGTEADVTRTADGRYAIVISDIGAYQLGEKVEIVVNGNLTYNISALSYANVVLNSSTTKDVDKDVVKALYEYYVAAKAYRDEINR